MIMSMYTRTHARLRIPCKMHHNARRSNCIGTGFALMEAVLVLASILQRYRLVPLDRGLFPLAEPRITLRPAAVRLRLLNRRRAL
jgi:hypothetical protein